jgi:hypothetical protein
MRRKMLDAKCFSIRKRERLLEHSDQFAEIAGPFVQSERISRTSRDERRRLVPEVLKKLGQNLIKHATAFAKWRKYEVRTSTESMKQVEPEPVLQDVVVEVSPRSRDNANTQLTLLASALS